MRGKCWIAILAIVVIFHMAASAENLTGKVKKAIEQSTLDEPGTKPFHLKAELSPSLERDKDSGRTGQVEIWWASPTRWRRELRSPEFHQIEVMDGNREWQRNEGDFFPEWLREIATALVRPVPPLEEVLEQVKSAEARNLFGRQINIGWVTNTGTPEVHNIRRSVVSLNAATGELLYAFGFGWGGGFAEYQDFHGRRIARKVSSGSPEVTARLVTLQDLGLVEPDLFNASAKGGDAQILQTVLLDEPSLRKNLLPSDSVPWPPLQDGVLQGNITTNVIVDRAGRVRELDSIVSENNAINEAGRQRILGMRFTPFTVNGIPVQAMSQITVPFKTARPSGTESFESARTYFDRGRQISFPAAHGTTPYVLRAEFEAGTKNGVVKGRYEDTWISDTQWRREAWFEKSHFVRSRNADKLYQSAEGPEAGLLQLVFRVMEPIPATDTFQESDWRIKRDEVNGVRAIRVLSGYESPEGKLDPDQSRGYWFDESGLLLKTYFNGLETRRSSFEEFAGTKISHSVDLFKDDRLAMKIRITEVTSPVDISAKFFELKGHPSTRAFTSEVR